MEVEKYILVVVEPLLTVLVNEEQFISTLNEGSVEVLQQSRYQFPLCLILLFVLRILKDLPGIVY